MVGDCIGILKLFYCTPQLGSASSRNERARICTRHSLAGPETVCIVVSDDAELLLGWWRCLMNVW